MKRSIGIIVLCGSALLGLLLATVVRTSGLGPGVLTAGPPTAVAASTPTPNPSGTASVSSSARPSSTPGDTGYIGTKDLLQPADFAAAGWDPASVDSDVSEGDLQVATTGCQRQTLQLLAQTGQTFSVTEGRRHYDAAVLVHRDRFGLFSIGSATPGRPALTTEQMNAVARSALSRLSPS